MGLGKGEPCHKLVSFDDETLELLVQGFNVIIHGRNLDKL